MQRKGGSQGRVGELTIGDIANIISQSTILTETDSAHFETDCAHTSVIAENSVFEVSDPVFPTTNSVLNDKPCRELLPKMASSMAADKDLSSKLDVVPSAVEDVKKSQEGL